MERGRDGGRQLVRGGQERGERKSGSKGKGARIAVYVCV